MSDEKQAEKQPEKQPKGNAKAEAKAEAQGGESGVPKGHKKYVSSAYSVLFDVQVKGEVIRGSWGPGKKVEFFVPEELVEGFEKHYHCQVGNVVPA